MSSSIVSMVGAGVGHGPAELSDRVGLDFFDVDAELSGAAPRRLALISSTWISHSPRASDAEFNPQPGDWVTVGDDEEPSIRGRITRRDANKVWGQLQLGLVVTDAASHTVGHG